MNKVAVYFEASLYLCVFDFISNDHSTRWEEIFCVSSSLKNTFTYDSFDNFIDVSFRSPASNRFTCLSHCNPSIRRKRASNAKLLESAVKYQLYFCPVTQVCVTSLFPRTGLGGSSVMTILVRAAVSIFSSLHYRSSSG